MIKRGNIQREHMQRWLQVEVIKQELYNVYDKCIEYLIEMVNNIQQQMKNFMKVMESIKKKLQNARIGKYKISSGELIPGN